MLFITTLAYHKKDMYKFTSLIFMILLGFVFEVCYAQQSGQSVLFTENSGDWITGGEAVWTFEDGVLVGDAGGGDGFVMTNATYKHFQLELEFYPDQQVNSGIFLRCAKETLSASDCYEINIWDHHPNQSARTGAVVSRSEPLQTVETIDRWNTYKIVSSQTGIQAWINDVMVVDLKDSELGEGYIALQAANKGSIQFRNVSIQLLEQ